ncbi:copper-translocating P-type ATPase [Marinilabiliaceae bacterium JC017]|nr:copper-translocating P-type ATPase [Marinilabiliaceae bacterium JC017]
MTHIKTTTRTTFAVTGMSCAVCASRVEGILNNQAGVADAKVNFANSSVLVDYDLQVVEPLGLQKAVREGGYDLYIETDGVDNRAELEALKQKELTTLKWHVAGAMLLAAPIMTISMFFPEMPYFNLVLFLLTTLLLGLFGRRFFVSALKQLKNRTANMDTLVATSTGIAYLYSVFTSVYPEFWLNKGLEAHVYYEAAAAIIAFISLGKLLEEKAKAGTSEAIKKLMGLQPNTVTRVEADGQETVIPIREVTMGHLIRVKPGERIAVDGKVQTGSSYVDESMITGEPVPVEKSKGQQVFAGTINQRGSFTFSAEKVGGDTLLAHIIKKVQEAQGSKAPVQRLVDKIASVFVPVVIGISMLTFITWMVAGGEHAFTHALLSSITVLVIACPCALGLATPTAIMVGVGKGAQHNILIKDAESLELAHKVNAVVLDKTGTITEGKPMVTDVMWFDGADQEWMKRVLLAIEGQSEHPLAEAVVAKLKDDGVVPVKLDHFESITGQGVVAELQGERFLVGNRALIDRYDVKHAPFMEEKAMVFRNDAKTVIYFANGENVVAVVAIADQVKSASKTAITSMQKKGIAVYMLSGDNNQTVAAVARQVGVKHFRAEVLPDDKAAFVKELQQKNKIVAMVGDGINDSQALAQADVSIAMGKGSDIAMEVAKVTLITSDLNVIPRALKLSRQTVATIKQNLFWALIYNSIGIPLAAGVLYSVNGFLLNPMIAAAAMAFSSVSVVMNSLRLKLKSLD